MKKYLTLLIALLLFLEINAQNISKKADSLRKIGKIYLAIKEYGKVYKKNLKNRNNTYNLACAYAITKQLDSAFFYLNTALKNDSSVRPLTDPDFYFLINDSRWTKIEKFLIKNTEAKYGKYRDIELSKKLWQMKIKDQAFYYHISVASKLLDRKSPINNALWELKAKINNQNLRDLDSIINKYGYPQKTVVGGIASQTPFFVIQHADIDVQKRYLPMMKKAAKEKEMSRAAFAYLTDRINLQDGKKQIYGTQITQKEDGTYLVQDLKEPEKVNKRRKAVGLPPIEGYLKRWNIKWTIKQK